MEENKNVRDMTRNELLEFLEIYTYTDKEFQDIEQDQLNLIEDIKEQKENDKDWYEDSFQCWHYNQRNNHKLHVEENYIPDLDKKYDHHKKSNKIPTMVLGIIVAFAVSFLILFIFLVIKSLLPTSGDGSSRGLAPLTIFIWAIWITGGVIGYKYHDIKAHFIQKQIDNLRFQAAEKDDEEGLLDEEARLQYKIDRYIRDVDLDYNKLIEETENDLTIDLQKIRTDLEVLGKQIPKDFHSYKKTYAMYKLIENGLADTWKEAAQIYLSRQQHEEVMNQLISINQNIENGLADISHKIQEQNMLTSNAILQIEKANNTISRIDNHLIEVDERTQKRHEEMISSNQEIINSNDKIENEVKQIRKTTEEIDFKHGY